MKRLITIFFVLTVVITIFTGCGGGTSAAPYAEASSSAAVQTSNQFEFGGLNGAFKEEAMAAYDDAEPAEAPASSPALGGDDAGGIAGPTVNQAVDTRKIIKNVTIQLQTLTFDTGVDSIEKIAEEFGGFVQDSYVEGRDMYNERGTRSANFTIRVPAERLDSFVNSLGSGFNVISKSQNSQDITESYFDSKARLDALKVQEERLLAMLGTASELEYLLQVEKELMNVRYEIESLTSSLNRMDSYVSLSTVYITLYEVIKYEPVENVPVTFSERVSRAFSTSLENFSGFSQDFAVGFIYSFPFILCLVVVVIVLAVLTRKVRKKSAAKKAAMQQQYIQYQNQHIHSTQQAQQVQQPQQQQKAQATPPTAKEQKTSDSQE